MLYTGIDLHKRTVVIATVDETGKVHRRKSPPRAFWNRPRKQQVKGSGPFTILW